MLKKIEKGANKEWQFEVLIAHLDTKLPDRTTTKKKKQPHGRMSTKWTPHHGGHPT